MAAAPTELLAEELQEALSGSVQLDVDLSKLSRWRIGGRAFAVVEPASTDEVVAVMVIAERHQVPLVVVGETSNLLFDSAGFEGVLMRIGSSMANFAIDGRRVRAQAGVSVPELVRATARAGLAGIEHAAGIPGTLGGLVLMNGGSQRKGIGAHVTDVTAVDGAGVIQRIPAESMGLAYRTTSLQGRGLAIVDIGLILEKTPAEAALARIDAIIAERAGKFPLDLPNCGSTFLSDPALFSLIGPPGRAIEEAGLKGRSRGGAQISPRHANFIVNHGSATDDDVLWLIALARRTVKERTGVLMNCEVRHLSPSGRLRPAHEVADERWRPEATSLPE